MWSWWRDGEGDIHSECDMIRSAWIYLIQAFPWHGWISKSLQNSPFPSPPLWLRSREAAMSQRGAGLLRAPFLPGKWLLCLIQRKTELAYNISVRWPVGDQKSTSSSSLCICFMSFAALKTHLDFLANSDWMETQILQIWTEALYCY